MNRNRQLQFVSALPPIRAGDDGTSRSVGNERDAKVVRGVSRLQPEGEGRILFPGEAAYGRGLRKVVVVREAVVIPSLENGVGCDVVARKMRPRPIRSGNPARPPSSLGWRNSCLAGEHVHDAAHRFRSIERGKRSASHLDLLNARS